VEIGQCALGGSAVIVREFGQISEEPIMKRVSLLLCLLALALSAIAQPPQSAAKKSAAPAPPDRACLQRIWDNWATLDPANAAKFYASGPHTFFDIAPLKYGSWDEYAAGSKALLLNYKSAKFTLNDDLAIHPHGDLVWATATVSEQMTTKAGKVEMGNFRWTVVLENQDGKWLTVHEHVSEPLQ
jgi:ketosteroid isomerase-like protein